MSLPLNTLSSLLTLQETEDDKPRLSKISWLPDVLVFRGSIVPTVLGPVLGVTCWSGVVAAISVWWGKEVGLTNSIVPLLSVVVGLLLVFRNSSAYERYAEGRKDFTALISASRNLSRLIWVVACLPPPSPDGKPSPCSRAQLTSDKKRLIRLIVSFVVATKHHLRAEGGVHHDDLKGNVLLSDRETGFAKARWEGSGLLPPKLAGSHLHRLRQASCPLPDQPHAHTSSPTSLHSPLPSPSPTPHPHQDDEESLLGLPHKHFDVQQSPSTVRSHVSEPSRSRVLARLRPHHPLRAGLKRRPTAVRVVVPEDGEDDDPPRSGRMRSRDKGGRADERTPLIKAGVRPDVRKTADEVDAAGTMMQRAEVGLGRMVELGLPLIIAHEISRTIFRFRRMGFLENVGPAGVNAMQALLQNMTDQLGSMERIVQTPMPYIIAVHMKQATTMLLFLMPFMLVDTLGVKMVPLIFFIALIYMGIEGIAAQVEQPFGNDPCDLNLDLFCTELRCECEALLERLPEGDEDDDDDDQTFFRSAEKSREDAAADDGGDDGAE